MAGPACPLKRLLRVHDERAEHPSHLLHCHVRVVEESTCLMDVELIDKASARLHRRLADSGLSIVLDGVFKAVPVNRSQFRQPVLEDHAHMVALIDLNRRSRSAAIEAPGVNRLERADLLFHHLGGQVKDLRVPVHRVGHISDVGSHDRHVESWAGVCLVNALVNLRVLPGFPKQLRSAQPGSTQSEGALEKRTSIVHMSSRLKQRAFLRAVQEAAMNLAPLARIAA